MTVASAGPSHVEDVSEDTHADPTLVCELEGYGVIKGRAARGGQVYDETEREILRAVPSLARHGVGGRNLRVSDLGRPRRRRSLQQIPDPALAIAESRSAEEANFRNTQNLVAAETDSEAPAAS